MRVYRQKEIIDAITKSGFSEILTRYPDGINHMIDQAGSSLSVGGDPAVGSCANLFV